MKKGCAMQSLRRSISWPSPVESCLPGPLETWRDGLENGRDSDHQPTTHHSFCSAPETPPGNRTKAAPLWTLRIFSYISWDQGCNGVATGWAGRKSHSYSSRPPQGASNLILATERWLFGHGRWVDGGCIHWCCFCCFYCWCSSSTLHALSLLLLHNPHIPPFSITHLLPKPQTLAFRVARQPRRPTLDESALH